MSNVLEMTYGEVKRFKASNVSNPDNKIFIKLSITRFTRLLVMSGLYSNKNMRYGIDFNKIDFTVDTDYYKLDDATYIGTVGSTITDVSMDIYYIQELIDGDNIGYFIAFPTLLLLPNVTALSTRLVELEAVIFGIDDKCAVMRSSSLEIPFGKSVTPYLKNINFTAPNKISNKLITLPGLDEDSLYTSTEIYVSNGQCNGDKTQPNQYLDLGPIDDLVVGFNPAVGVDLTISTIRQTTHNSYAYSVGEKVNMKSGNLCIPLNF